MREHCYFTRHFHCPCVLCACSSVCCFQSDYTQLRNSGRSKPWQNASPSATDLLVSVAEELHASCLVFSVCFYVRRGGDAIHARCNLEFLYTRGGSRAISPTVPRCPLLLLIQFAIAISELREQRCRYYLITHFCMCIISTCTPELEFGKPVAVFIE